MSSFPRPDCRIIGIGNSLFYPDSAGPKTLQLLSSMAVRDGIELLDGGIGGLNLLSLLEHIHRVIFVDAIEGFLDSPGIAIFRLPSEEIRPEEYDHNAGLAYLTTVAAAVIPPPMPDCLLVGVEGAPDEQLCSEAARICLRLANEQESTLFLNTQRNCSEKTSNFHCHIFA